MFLTIANVLDAEALRRVQDKADALDWSDGARTAGGRARAVKRNEQADLTKGVGAGLHTFLMETIERHPVVRAVARPKRFSRLLVSRAGQGGGYGAHVDNALMQGMRTDLSFTLFLSDPDTYEGGALRLETPEGDHAARPAAGDLVIYPSGAIHEVEPVTRGMRVACVGWIESHVRRADQRAILFDLEQVRLGLPRNAPQVLTLDKTISNLLRMWADA